MAEEGWRGESSVSESVWDIMEHYKIHSFFFSLFLELWEMEQDFCILISGLVTIDVKPFIPVSARYPAHLTCIGIPLRRN